MYWGYVGIMEKNMETTMNYRVGLRGKCLGVRVWVSGSRVWWCSLGFSALGGSGERGRLIMGTSGVSIWLTRAFKYACYESLSRRV